MVNNYYGRPIKGEPPPDPPKPFDLIEEQAIARDCLNSEKLFKQWDNICKLYEKHQITTSNFEDMRDIILPNLEKLKTLKQFLV